MNRWRQCMVSICTPCSICGSIAANTPMNSVCTLRAPEHEDQADIERQRDEHREGDAADPAERREGAEEHLVRIGREIFGEAERPEPERPIEQHRDRADLVAEAALFAGIVILRQRRPLQRQFADRGDRQDDRPAAPPSPRRQPTRRRHHPPLELCRARRQKVRPSISASASMASINAPREKLTNTREQHHQQKRHVRRTVTPPQQQILTHPGDRRDQERREHVGVLEWPLARPPSYIVK